MAISFTNCQSLIEKKLSISHRQGYYNRRKEEGDRKRMGNFSKYNSGSPPSPARMSSPSLDDSSSGGPSSYHHNGNHQHHHNGHHHNGHKHRNRNGGNGGSSNGYVKNDLVISPVISDETWGIVLLIFLRSKRNRHNNNGNGKEMIVATRMAMKSLTKSSPRWTISLWMKLMKQLARLILYYWCIMIMDVEIHYPSLSISLNFYMNWQEQYSSALPLTSRLV